MSEIVRVLRVIEYVGPRDWVERTIQARTVKGHLQITEDKVIRESIVGDYPELLSENKMINITGLDKAAVLAALFNASRQQGMGTMQLHGVNEMTQEQAQEIIGTRPRRSMYFDYLHGRVMKIDIAGDTLDPRLYDRDLGEGAAARALAPLLRDAR